MQPNKRSKFEICQKKHKVFKNKKITNFLKYLGTKSVDVGDPPSELEGECGIFDELSEGCSKSFQTTC